MVKIIFAPTLTRDLSLENEGVWVDLDGLGSEVKLRSANYEPFRTAMAALKKNNETFDFEAVFSEAGTAQRKIYVDIIVDHIIVDMKGLTDENGSPITYDANLAKEFLVDASAIVILSKIIEAMTTQEFFNQKRVIAEKN